MKVKHWKVEHSKLSSWWVDTSSTLNDGYVELIEWGNGDGVKLTASIDNNLGDRIIDLTWGELEAIVEMYQAIITNE